MAYNNQNRQNTFDKEEYQKHQIIRKDNANKTIGTILEVMDNSFLIGKVIVNFQTYNKNGQAGNKMNDKISVYIDFAEFLQLTADFCYNGWAHNEVMNNQYGYQLKMGGTSAARLAAQGRPRPDGNSEYRYMKVVKSSKGPNYYYINAESGPAQTGPTGGIAKIKGSKPDAQIGILLSHQDFMEILMVTSFNIQAYLNSKYMNLPKEHFEYKGRANNTPSNQYNNQNTNLAPVNYNQPNQPVGYQGHLQNSPNDFNNFGQY